MSGIASDKWEHGLTYQQANLLALLRSLKRTPSFDEMALSLGLASKSRIGDLLDALVDRGFIERIAGTARAIRVLPKPVSWVDPFEHISNREILAECEKRGLLKVAA